MKPTILLIASLLLLTHAAPGDEDFCSQFFGKNINYQDCRAALESVPVTQLSDLPNLSLQTNRLFSDEPTTEARFKLPQTFTSGQCVIEITMARGVTWAASTWDFQRKAMKKILDYCVQPHGIGGRVMQKGTTIEVRKKSNRLRPKPDPAVRECAALSEQGPLFKCLKDAEDAALAANRAYRDFSDRMDGLTYQIEAAIDNL